MFNVSCLREKRRVAFSEPAFCCQRYGVLLIFDNAKVLHFHCGLRIQWAIFYLSADNLLQRYSVTVLQSIFFSPKILLYYIIYIYYI